MNFMIQASFFIVLSGTQTPVGFSSKETACAYMTERPKAALFAWQTPGLSSCYAIEDGCRRAQEDREALGIPMFEVKCVWREKSDRVLEVHTK